MSSPGVNLVMTVIGFTVSTTFIVFVCTRLIWARIQLTISRRSSFSISSRSDLSSSMIQDMRDELGSISRKGFDVKFGYGLRSKSQRVVQDNSPPVVFRCILSLSLLVVAGGSKVRDSGYDHRVNETVNVVIAKTSEIGQRTWGIMRGVMALATQKVEELTKDDSAPGPASWQRNDSPKSNSNGYNYESPHKGWNSGTNSSSGGSGHNYNSTSSTSWDDLGDTNNKNNNGPAKVAPSSDKSDEWSGWDDGKDDEDDGYDSYHGSNNKFKFWCFMMVRLTLVALGFC